MHGLADGIFWSGVFAFVSASINAIKTGIRSIKNAKLASSSQSGSQPCSTAGSCFIAGTLVACLDEEGNEITKPIEDIRVGDKVLAYDEKTGKNTYKPVLHLFRNKSEEWTGIIVNGEEIISTPGHKYFLPESKKWVSAEKLEVGINVLLSNGEYGIIEAVRSVHYDIPQTTYNFEVADVHTYYVGTGVCVHNMCQGEKSASTLNHELSDVELKNFGQNGKNSGFRQTLGTHQQTIDFVKSQTNALTEYAPGKFVGYNSRGIEFRIYPKVLNNYTSIRINGVSGLKGIKFIWP